LSIKSYLFAFASAVLFGAATPASKALLATVSPYQLAGLLYLGAALGVIPLLFKSQLKLPWKLDRRHRWQLSGAILFGGILAPIFLLLGLQLATAASVSLWLNLELVATAILGYFIFHDRLGKWGWIGISGTVVAAALLSWGEGIAGIEAGLLVTLACICWALDNHLTALIDGITPAESTFWKGIVAGCVNLTIGLTIAPNLPSLSNIGAGLLLGALSYGASIVLYITSAQSLGATRSQIIFSCAPFFGMVLSVLTLGETITIVQKIAIVLKVSSLLAILQDRHSHEHQHQEIAHEHFHSHNDGHHNHFHERQSASLKHSHWHEHESIAHVHPHLPDLHHRHRH
jgi:drug/metabolite transporter (DMT)-like permease